MCNDFLPVGTSMSVATHADPNPEEGANAQCHGTWAHPADVFADAATRKPCGDLGQHAEDGDIDPVSSPSTVEGPSSPSTDCQGDWSEHVTLTTIPVEKPAAKQVRKTVVKSANCKPQRTCLYEHCPSPMHSSKWRVVTATTVAGNRDWQSLFGMTLCDSCYSTYRKHGTFIRSVRTAEGWARFDHSVQAHILNKPSKKRVVPAPRQVKRSRPAVTANHSGMAASVKRCRLVIDEVGCEDTKAGRPKRERKPSAKLRDTLGGLDGDAGSQDEETLPETPATTAARCRDHFGWPGPESYGNTDIQQSYYLQNTEEEVKVEEDSSLEEEAVHCEAFFPVDDPLHMAFFA